MSQPEGHSSFFSDPFNNAKPAIHFPKGKEWVDYSTFSHKKGIHSNYSVPSNNRSQVFGQSSDYLTHQNSPFFEQKRSLNPEQMPNPIQVMKDDQKLHQDLFDTAFKGQLPPLISSDCIVRDYGISSPRFIRSSLYSVPISDDLMKKTNIPFGLVITPFAHLHPKEIQPPLSDFGKIGPIRCIRCKAYMSPFMQFIDGGKKFLCVFCKATNDVPESYFQHLDHDNQRIDRFQRPELCLGTYEILATNEYCRESVTPNRPVVIFALDVSFPMIKDGVVQLLCQNMKSLLKNLAYDEFVKNRPRIGFITYDNIVNFYNLDHRMSQPQQLSVTDLEDIFVPVLDGFLVDPVTCEHQIDVLMEKIPLLFSKNKKTNTVLAPIIQATSEAMKTAKCTGKVIIFHHSLPIANAPGKLQTRIQENREKRFDHQMMKPQTAIYYDLGKQCVNIGCAVDLFLFNNTYIDVATASYITGGQVYKYSYFQPHIDGERFLRDLEQNLSISIGFDGTMRVRTSTGIRPVNHYGNFNMSNATDVEIANLGAFTTVACEIKHDDKIDEDEGVFIQTATLFTSVGGQRRLRIINLALNSTSSLSNVFKNCELDTMMNILSKQVVCQLKDKTKKELKAALISRCANVLACYRESCTNPSSAGQLILPECMKLLPLYINSLLKSDLLSEDSSISPDDYSLLLNIAFSMDLKSTYLMLYPQLFDLNELAPNETNEFQQPLQIRCSFEKIETTGAYMLDNGFSLYFYLGPYLDPSWVNEVFGVSSFHEIDVNLPSLPKINSALSRKIRNFIDKRNSNRQRLLRLQIVKGGEKSEAKFKRYLYEDKISPKDSFSYIDFLCHIHREIRAILNH